MRRLLALLVLLAPANAAAADRWMGHVTSGYAAGIEDNDSVRKGELRLGGDFRPARFVSFGLELAFVRFAGSRDGRDVGCVGGTLLPVVAWHFFRHGDSSATFELGYGGAAFSRGFPPGGTVLNGYSALGVGGRIALRPNLLLVLGLRLFHHSNGRGFAEDNPAFDGIGVNVGTGFGLAP